MFGWLKNKAGDWASRTQEREIRNYIAILRKMDGDELGRLIANAAILRVRFSSTGVITCEALDSSLPRDIKDIELYDLRKLTSIVISYIKNDNTIAEMATKVILYSVQALIYDNLRELGRSLWAELERGFPSTEREFGVLQSRSNGLIDESVRRHLSFVPVGLEPISIKESLPLTEAHHIDQGRTTIPELPKEFAAVQGNPLNDWNVLAEQGDAETQFKVAKRYESTGDYANAADLFRKAADQEYPDAQFSLGVSYIKGLGVPRDDIQAANWFRKAAEHGHADAQYNLGYLYFIGQGVEEDYAEAIKWYRKSAERGTADAQHNLGVLYYFGQGVPLDYTEAAKWYRKAAEQGYINAWTNLGILYHGGQGVPLNYAEAEKWLRMAAAQGIAEAEYNLGVMYYTGRGVPQDYIMAAGWYRRAAEQSMVNAQHSLAFMYQYGQGVLEDYAEAVKWYGKAAQQGSTEAQHNLGTIFYNGRSVAQNYSRSYRWFSMAASRGNAASVEARDTVAALMTADEITKAQALEGDRTFFEIV